MIEFYGVVSFENNNYKRKKTDKLISNCAFVSCALCTLYTIFLGVYESTLNYGFYCMLALSVIIFICGLIIVRPMPNYRQQMFKRVKQVSKITIKNGIIENENDYGKKTKSLSKVKKILDVGECYYIIFKFGDISSSWICQKDLITNGTIEEFEKLFEDKIICKAK